MSILAQVYAEGGDVILNTIELFSEAWPGDSITLVQDYQDHEISTEDGRVLLAEASGMAVALPKRDATGAQNLRFAIDGVRPRATRLLRQATEAQVQINLTFRKYLYSDLSEPAAPPYFLIVRQFAAQADQVEVTAGMFDLIDMRWPRELYNSINSPCLKYM